MIIMGLEKQKVCRKCKRIVLEDKCPVCAVAEFSRTWKGVVLVNDPKGSEIASLLDLKVPGKYALWVK